MGKPPDNRDPPTKLSLLTSVGPGLENGVSFLPLPPPDVTLSPWSGDSKCHQRRVLTYTIPINNPLGPKSASVVETQVCRVGRPPGGGAGGVGDGADSPLLSGPCRRCSGAALRRAGVWWTRRC